MEQTTKQNKVYYAGIGSREISEQVQLFFLGLGKFYAKQGFILRSGGADGSDLCFEHGSDMAKGQKEIFIPWKDFNNSQSELYNIPDKAFDIAARIHPNWANLKDSVKRLHARNVMQILGEDLKTPVKFVACYTKNGEEKGGTRTAIVLAKQHNIPIFNYGLIFN